MNDKYVLEYSMSRYASWLFFGKLYSISEVGEALSHFFNGLVMSGIFDSDSMDVIGINLSVDYENEKIVVKILD